MNSFIKTALHGHLSTGLVSAAALLGAVACQPELPHSPPSTFVTAVFDPTTAQVPLPNDLVFLGSLNSACPAPDNAAPLGTPPKCAQAELLASFNGQFPNDQEVAITIDFTQTSIDGNGTVTQSAPDLDLTSFTPSTFLVYADVAGGRAPLAIDPITDADYVKSTDHGTLTLHNANHAPWAPGSYAVFVRGGASGVHTKDNIPVSSSQIFDLIAQGKDLSDPANLGLLKASTGSAEAALAEGQQLEALIALYNAAAFPIVDAVFPHQELAILTTFKITAETNVPIDPARGAAPLPIDLLRGADGKLTPVAACTLASAKLASDGTCQSPAAAGFLALDGFSTTGAILAPTSELIQAATINAGSVRLYDLSIPAQPALVPAASLILEPCEFTSACPATTALSPVIAIQPSGATSGDSTSVFRTRPLKDNTDYAVVITTAVHDKAGKPLGSSTVAKILGFTNPVVVAGKSALLGVDDATAAALDKMRLQLQPVYTTLAADNVKHTDVAIAYTFHTQTIVSQALQLAAAPYVAPASTAVPVPGSLQVHTADDGFTKFGGGALPHGNIDEILEADIITFDALDPATGAFLPDPTKAAPEVIHVLIATPKGDNTNIPGCTGALAQAGFDKCAPLMVFRHGLQRGRIDMLTVADSYAAAGMITVAIDAAKHGDRSFCTSGPASPTSGCAGGAACTAIPGTAGQGDANPPGTCPVATGFAKVPLSAAPGSTDGIPAVSGNYLISANFFRTRDTLRQDLIDQSQLIRVMAFAPDPNVTHEVFQHIVQRSIATTGHHLLADPATVYFSSQSLGSIQGTMDVATNPRISKAAFNVGGGTLVDIFTQSPAFVQQTNLLLLSLGIEPNTPQYLQFLVVAKTVLDPADPINYADRLINHPLPNLLSPTPAFQLPKAVLTQAAYCDQVVPNFTNFLWASNIGTGPLPPAAFTAGATGTASLFITAPFASADFGKCDVGATLHGFLTDWKNPALTQLAQTDIVNFVMHDTKPPSVELPQTP